MKRWLKILIGLFSFFILFSITSYFVIKNYLYSSVPNYNFEKKVTAINSDINIYFDSLAVAYIDAESEEDAAFALGYLHARERMFQMDLIRRAGAGELSEIFGEETLPFDRMFRTIGIATTAKEIIKQASPETKKMLDAYSRGVNYFLFDSGEKLSIEFDVLNYEPKQWKPEHSIIVIRMMAWELNIAWWCDFVYSHAAEKLGKESAKKVLPAFDEQSSKDIQNYSGEVSPLSSTFFKSAKEFRNFIGIRGTQTGSNNWVVNGNKSTSGLPIIANDPHLAFSAPGKWYSVVINSNSWNVAGVTLPGIPGIVIGKNNSIAWALTNLMSDETDFYVEKLDKEKKNYFVDGKWLSLKERIDTIHIKGGNIEIYKTLFTHRGPIIIGVHPFDMLFENSKKQNAVSMKWLGNEISDDYLAFYKLNHAQNKNDFISAIQNYSLPAQNFIYADAEDNIGYQAGGRLPIREGNPAFFFDGTTTKYDWKGFVSYSEMPRFFNTAEGFIATANNKVNKNFKYYISSIWEPSSRIERITELLNSKQKHSAEDFMLYQSDFTSPYAKKITPYIISAFDKIKINDKNLERALKILKEWDYNFDAFTQAPTIYTSFLRFFIKNTFGDEYDEKLFFEYSFVANIIYRTIEKIIPENYLSIYDDNSTDRIENRDFIIRKSLSDALTDLEKRISKDLIDWQWGRIHKVTFKHFFAGQSKLLDNVINIGPYGIGGDGTTLFNTEYSFFEYNGKISRFKTDLFANVLGPSMRFIFDFANPEEFYLVQTTGQSGNIFSAHYDDQTLLWISGKYMKINTNKNNFENLKQVIRLRKN